MAAVYATVEDVQTLGSAACRLCQAAVDRSEV